MNEERLAWLTQEWDVEDGYSDAIPFGAEAACSKLGLLHYLGKRNDLVLYFLRLDDLNGKTRRPTVADAGPGIAYLAISSGERFQMTIDDLNVANGGSRSSLADTARALDLNRTHDSRRIVDGGIEFVATITHRELKGALIEAVPIGAVDVVDQRRKDVEKAIVDIRSDKVRISKIIGFLLGSSA